MLKLLLALAFTLTAIGWLSKISEQKVRGRKQNREKRLAGSTSRKESWIISAWFSTLGGKCLGDCQGWQSNRAGLIANANEGFKPLAFISTTKQTFPSRKEGRSSLMGHSKQVVTSRGTGRVGEYWSLEATLEAV